MANDFLLDNDGDLAIVDGDFNIGFSDEKHIKDILSCTKGEYKQNPLLGVDLFSFLNAPLTLKSRQKLEKEIAIQLLSDNVKEINVTTDNEGGIKVEGKYD